MIYFLLLLSAMSWGGTWVAGRVVVSEVPPFTAAFIRFALATVFLWLLVRWREGALPRVTRTDCWRLLLLGLVGIFGYNFFFLHGLEHITASRGALLITINPALIALIAWGLQRFYRQRDALLPHFGWQKWCGVLLALLGNLIVLTQGDLLQLNLGIGRGEWLILGCILTWVLYTFIGRGMDPRFSGLSTNFYACALGTLFLGLGALTENQWNRWQAPYFGLDYSAKSWGAIGFLALFGTALAYSWYTEGVKQIGAARTAAFTNLVSIFGVLFGALLLDERLRTTTYIGGGLTLCGVLLTNDEWWRHRRIRAARKALTPSRLN